MDPIPWWVESYMRPVEPYLDGGLPYQLSPPCDVVLSELYGVGMASDRTEVIVVPLVLVGLVRCAYPY